MSYITADCLMNRKLFSGDRCNSLMIAEDSSGCTVASSCGPWTGHRGMWVGEKLHPPIARDCGFSLSHGTSATPASPAGNTQWIFGMGKAKAPNEYCLEMNCKRSARSLKLALIPRAILNLHSTWGQVHQKPVQWEDKLCCCVERGRDAASRSRRRTEKGSLLWISLCQVKQDVNYLHMDC